MIMRSHSQKQTRLESGPMQLFILGTLCPIPFRTPLQLRRAVLIGAVKRFYAGGIPVVLSDCGAGETAVRSAFTKMSHARYEAGVAQQLVPRMRLRTAKDMR